MKSNLGDMKRDVTPLRKKMKENELKHCFYSEISP